jgi:hypothetical protein
MISEIAREELKQKLDHPKKSLLVETLDPERYEFAHIGARSTFRPTESKRTARSDIPEGR